MTRPLVLVAALSLLTAACRKKTEVAANSPAPTPAAQQLSVAPEPLPDWATQPPRLVESGSRRMAVAVGVGSAANVALARSAAEAQARAAIGGLLERKASTASVEMAVSGARVVQTYTAADGRVYVQVEAPAHR